MAILNELPPQRLGQLDAALQQAGFQPTHNMTTNANNEPEQPEPEQPEPKQNAEREAEHTASEIEAEIADQQSRIAAMAPEEATEAQQGQQHLNIAKETVRQNPYSPGVIPPAKNTVFEGQNSATGSEGNNNNRRNTIAILQEQEDIQMEREMEMRAAAREAINTHNLGGLAQNSEALQSYVVNNGLGEYLASDPKMEASLKAADSEIVEPRMEEESEKEQAAREDLKNTSTDPGVQQAMDKLEDAEKTYTGENVKAHSYDISELKKQYENGEISKEEFEEQVEQVSDQQAADRAITFRDAAGDKYNELLDAYRREHGLDETAPVKIKDAAKFAMKADIDATAEAGVERYNELREQGMSHDEAHAALPAEQQDALLIKELRARNEAAQIELNINNFSKHLDKNPELRQELVADAKVLIEDGRTDEVMAMIESGVTGFEMSPAVKDTLEALPEEVKQDAMLKILNGEELSKKEINALSVVDDAKAVKHGLSDQEFNEMVNASYFAEDTTLTDDTLFNLTTYGSKYNFQDAAEELDFSFTNDKALNDAMSDLKTNSTQAQGEPSQTQPSFDTGTVTGFDVSEAPEDQLVSPSSTPIAKEQEQNLGLS